MSSADFYFNPEGIKDVIKPMGYSIVSNMIIKEGYPVGFMYREEPVDEEDSGWRFLSGSESEDYLDDEENSKAISVNAVANHDPAIIKYLKSKTGSAWERIEGTDNFAEYSDQ